VQLAALALPALPADAARQEFEIGESRAARQGATREKPRARLTLLRAASEPEHLRQRAPRELQARMHAELSAATQGRWSARLRGFAPDSPNGADAVGAD
jgi:hypothetical protein